MLLAPVIVSMWTAVAIAGPTDGTAPEWKASCHWNGVDFSIQFKVQTPGDDQGDMKVTAAWATGKEIAIPLPVALYVPRGMISDVGDVCDRIGAIHVDRNRVLLLISSDSRPTWDRLNLVLLDVVSPAVLDVQADAGKIKDVTGRGLLTLRRRPGGHEIRLEREWLLHTNADSAENSIEDWRTIEVSGGKIVTRWSR